MLRDVFGALDAGNDGDDRRLQVLVVPNQRFRGVTRNLRRSIDASSEGATLIRRKEDKEV